MGLIQRMMTAIVSEETAALWEAETRQYQATCKKCQHQYDAWDIGAIIYKATSDRHALVRCPACGKRSMTWFDKRQQPDN
ncbi:hypothetical protein K3179_01860 [Qipengyuania sp. GH38]|uniref:hypothetical protein n=1 Tax=Qipengyuania intermedia TaxID=2867244 RepID=UPI001C88D857|nr:hypothetical protein [Qipengyuania intermedia]MBX7513287.1 hypothetical protein [Qipengyuania intermedia]